MIRGLSEDVRCRLRSGIAITSVSQCVEELVLNSADAQATCIAIRVDLEIFRVQVVDNGCGLGPEDMERVGVRYFTSKCHSLKDLEDLRCYGFRGEAIASMVDVCSVTEICSKHKPTGKTFTKLFQNRKPLPVQRAEVTRPSVGTTVTLYNLFYNLPVRKGCVDPVLELERIRQKVEAASLMKPDISFSLKNDALHSMVLQLPKTRDVCSRFCQIYGPVKSQHLREIRHTQDRLGIAGYISCEGHYNKTMQFLYVNSRLVLKTRLHKLIDFLLKKESVICRPKASQGAHTGGSPGLHRTSSDQHGIYVLNIQCSYEEYDVCFEPDKTLIEFQDWSSVLLFTEEALKNFLKKENLYSEPSKEELTEFNQKHHLSLSCHELSPEIGSEPLTSISKLAMNSFDPASLRSKAVCRRKVMSLQGMDDEKTDMKRTSTETILLASSASRTVTTEGFVCPNVNSDITACRTGAPNLVTDREEHLQQNKLCHSDVTPACSNDPELATSSSSLAQQCTPSIKTLHAEPKAEDLISAKSSGGDPDHPSVVTHKPLDSAVREKKLHQTIADCADRLAVFSGRNGALGTDRPTSMPIYEVATPVVPPEPSKQAKPLKLQLVLGSLDKFKRSYGNKGPAASDAVGPQLPYGAEPAITETSWRSVDRIQPALPETTLHAEGEKNVVLGRPLTSTYSSLKVKEPGTGKAHSSLSTKLCRLKRDMELASFPLEIQSGELQLKNDAVPSTDTIDVVSLDCQPERDEPEPRPPQTAIHPQEAEASEWLQHYEQTLGRNVFINTSTGLSTYSAPQADQPATCTKDLSTMSVSVVCNNGFQYQCHPFRSELLVPFLPRPNAERGIPSHKGDESLQTLYSKWQNPVFPRHPEVAVDTSKDRSDSLAVKIHNILYPYRFTKDMILTMEVLQQVDNKFIACLVDTKTERKKEPGGNLLVLVDQHAAHERVRLEQLIADSYEPSSEDGGRRLKVSTVKPPLELDVTEEQGRLLRIRAGVLQRAGLSISFPDNCPSQVLVSEIPRCFLEKNVSDTRKKRVTVARKMVEEFLQEEVQQSPGAPLGTLPGTVFKVLASQACHGAVKFNDPLTVDECRHLVRCLAQCSLPFQCAHGRPAILPLADLLHLPPEDEVPPKPNLSRLRRHYKAWKLFGTTRSSCGTEQPIREETHPDTQQSQVEVEP